MYTNTSHDLQLYIRVYVSMYVCMCLCKRLARFCEVLTISQCGYVRYMCVCVCTYACMCICMHAHKCHLRQTFLSPNYLCMHVCACVFTYVHTHIHINQHLASTPDMSSFTHIRHLIFLNVCIHAHTFIHTCMHVHYFIIQENFPKYS